MRTDTYAFLTLYRRIMPNAVEDIGVFQDFFGYLNVAGVITNVAIAIYVTSSFNNGHGYTHHERDTIFIALVMAFFSVMGAILCRSQPPVWVVLTKLENSLARSHRRRFGRFFDASMALIEFSKHGERVWSKPFDDAHIEDLVSTQARAGPPRTPCRRCRATPDLDRRDRWASRRRRRRC